IFCVCHSLGSVILKQALYIAAYHQPHHYLWVLEAIAGIIFISAPHADSNRVKTLQSFTRILKAVSIQATTIPEKELLIFLKRFEDLNLHIPILSTYETRETIIDKRFLRSTKEILVDASTCSTRARAETIVGLNLDHIQSCHFEQATGAGPEVIQKFLRETLGNGNELFPSTSEITTFNPIAMSLWASTVDIHSLDGGAIDIHSPDSGAIDRNSMDMNVGGYLQDPLVMKPGDIDFSRPALHLPCFILDRYAPNPKLCGRDSVLELMKEELLPSKTRAKSLYNANLKIFALCGVGGIGKTEVARQFASANKESFDAVFWVTADSIPQIDRSFHDISIKLGLEYPSQQHDPVVSRGLVKGWLSSNWRRIPADDENALEPSWLMVFDNADYLDLLIDYWPESNGSLLITSRDPLAKTFWSGKKCGIDLGPLSYHEGASLLIELAEIDDTANDAEENVLELAVRISHILSGIPLAISQIAGFIRDQNLCLHEFLDLYKDSAAREELFDMDCSVSSTLSYPHTIASVWGIERLRAEERGLLEFIAFLDPDGIKDDFLKELFPTYPGYLKSRTGLLRESLISRDMGSDGIRVLQLVQDTVRAKLDMHTLIYTVEKAVEILKKTWPHTISTSPMPPVNIPLGANLKCAALSSHVHKLQQLWSPSWEISKATRVQFAGLLVDVAW
ncbi:hypothetical protein K505DRAFT_234739, partial [Melanomma pulvis-pyrius CBS 109.77]